MKGNCGLQREGPAPGNAALQGPPASGLDMEQNKRGSEQAELLI